MSAAVANRIYPRTGDHIVWFLAVLLCAVICLPAVGRDVTTPWNNQPEVSRDLTFLSVEEQTEDGRSFQRFRFQSRNDAQRCCIEVELPDLQPLDEFTAIARVNSTHSGLRIVARMVLPNQPDPETKQPVARWMQGSRSTEPSEWQELRLSLSKDAITRQLIRLRSELFPLRINTEGLYIDRLGVQAEFDPGDAVIDLGSVTYGPIVLRSASESRTFSATSEQPITESRLRVERNQVYLNGERVFLRMLPWHNESTEDLQTLNTNMLWVKDYRPNDQTRALADAGLVLAATPPHPQLDPNDFSEPIVGLMPLDQVSDLVDVWLMGRGVPVEQLPHLQAWAREVQSADRLRGRPLMVHVTGAEGLASRHSDMVGIGQTALHQNRATGQARNEIFRRSRQASQLTLPWTWVDTESPPAMTGWRSDLGLMPLQVEPEQITMQVMAALSAGARAIAFWKMKPFGNGRLEDSETGLAVALANLQIDLFESWLVQGQAQSYIAIDDAGQRGRRDRDLSTLQQAVSSSMVSLNPLETEIPIKPDGTVLAGRSGSLILAARWDAGTQFVPGSLYSPEAKLVVGARETASASQIDLTGIQAQRRVETAGGLAVTLRDFDQFAFILVSSEPTIFRAMGQRVENAKPVAAPLKTRMARLKFDRVLQTCGEIDELRTSAPPSARRGLKNAERSLGFAESMLNDERYAEAIRQSDTCLRQLRHVQNLYWHDAIRQLPTPTASPFTIAFSSLPEHWRMLATTEAAVPSPNLLPGAVFDRLQEMEEAGWKVVQFENNPYSTQPDVRFDARNQARVLRLAAWRPQNSRELQSSRPSLVIHGPSIAVEAGDFLQVEGRVRIGSRIAADQDYPLMIFDSDLGPDFAVRPALESSWRTFRMYRQAAASGLFHVSFALEGRGDIHVDLDALMVRKTGRLEWQSGNSTTTTRSVSSSRVQGAGHSFPSPDWESSFR